MDMESIERQVGKSISFYRRTHGDCGFILYFQAYSNTNAPRGDAAPDLRRGLALATFRGLNVATRPDCLDEEKLTCWHRTNSGTGSLGGAGPAVRQ